MSTRRLFLSAIAGLATSSIVTPAFADDEKKVMVAYDDELKNGWQNWSWGAKVGFSVPAGGSKPIKVEGEPWSALVLHHDPVSMSGMKKLTFYINGGSAGDQALAIKATSDGGKMIASEYIIHLKAKTWTVVEVPLKDIGAEGKTIDGILWQGQATAYKPYYITRIQFE
jgi:hypothetical protein